MDQRSENLLPADQTDHPPSRKLVRELAGFALIAANMAIFASIHGVVRHMAQRLPPLEIAFITVLFSTLVFIPWLVRRGLRALATRRLGSHFLRAGFNAASICCWFTAITVVPLADATAVALAAPVIVIIGAAFFLGEQIHFWRWSAVIVGLSGALVIIRPGFETTNLGYLLVIGSAVASAGSHLFAKSLAGTDGRTVAVFYLTTLMAPLMMIPALLVWKWPSGFELLLMAVCGLGLSSGHFFFVTALKLADVSAVQPYIFTRLLWAALVGYLAFGEVPGTWTWIGGGMIFAAVTFAARREAMAARKQAGEN